MTGNATIGIERPGFVPPIWSWLIVFVFIIDWSFVYSLVALFVVVSRFQSLTQPIDQSINDQSITRYSNCVVRCQHYWMGNNVAMGFSQSFSRLISQPVSQSVSLCPSVGRCANRTVGWPSIGRCEPDCRCCQLSIPCCQLSVVSLVVVVDS